jgi:hypothetical protein
LGFMDAKMARGAAQGACLLDKETHEQGESGEILISKGGWKRSRGAVRVWRSSFAPLLRAQAVLCASKSKA